MALTILRILINKFWNLMMSAEEFCKDPEHALARLPRIPFYPATALRSSGSNVRLDTVREIL